MNDTLEQAYRAGNHHVARRIASQVVRAGATASDAELSRARRVLDETSPDSFLLWVGALGLGLVAWLVYNYLL